MRFDLLSVRSSGRRNESVGWAVLAAFVFFAAFSVLMTFSVTEAGAVSASPAFCKEATQLESWAGQQEEPGPDQYNLHPDSGILTSAEAYLEQIEPDAPSSLQPAFLEWIAFIKQEAADQAAGSQPTESQYTSASNAVSEVEKWIGSGSGCFAVAPVKKIGRGFHLPLWVWIVGGVVLLMIIGSVSNGSEAKQAAANSAPGAQSNPTYETPASKWQASVPDYTPKQQTIRCTAGCNDGYLQCPRCGGQGGSMEDFQYSDGHGIYQKWVQCSYGCAQGRVQCPTCHGSGQVTVYR